MVFIMEGFQFFFFRRGCDRISIDRSSLKQQLLLDCCFNNEEFESAVFSGLWLETEIYSFQHSFYFQRFVEIEVE